jgi:hypothetical protein
MVAARPPKCCFNYLPINTASYSIRLRSSTLVFSEFYFRSSFWGWYLDPWNTCLGLQHRYIHTYLHTYKHTKLFKHVTILGFSFTRKCFTQHGLHLNGYGKGLLAKQMACLIYKMSCQKTEEPISLEWKMGLNDNATSHPLTAAPNCSESQPDTVTCRTSTRITKPPVTRQNYFYGEWYLKYRK